MANWDGDNTGPLFYTVGDLCCVWGFEITLLYGALIAGCINIAHGKGTGWERPDVDIGAASNEDIGVTVEEMVEEFAPGSDSSEAIWNDILAICEFDVEGTVDLNIGEETWECSTGLMCTTDLSVKIGIIGWVDEGNLGKWISMGVLDADIISPDIVVNVGIICSEDIEDVTIAELTIGSEITDIIENEGITYNECIVSIIAVIDIKENGKDIGEIAAVMEPVITLDVVEKVGISYSKDIIDMVTKVEHLDTASH